MPRECRPTSTATPATEKLSQPDSEALLASQRTKRPVAPHITAYDPMHIWLGTSIWQRFTGIGFAGLLYAYAGAYLVAPLAGWHLESATAVAAVAAWPLAAKGALKFVLAWPFVFHGINGTRHLINDLGLGYTKKEIKASGLAIWGTSLAAGLAIAFLI